MEAYRTAYVFLFVEKVIFKLKYDVLRHLVN